MSHPITTFEIGSLKKPQWLVDFLRDPRQPREAKERARDDAAYLNLRMLEQVGLDQVYDGEARRVEMYEYAVRNIEGFEFTGRVRSWDNKYYRKARCVGEIKYKTPYHLREFLFLKKHGTKPLKVPVTGPYTLADWSYNEFYPTKEDFVLAIARSVIRPLLRDLVEAGAEFIQLDEPAATTHPEEMALFAEAFNESVKGIPGNTGVHICYSGDNYQSLFPHALEMKTSFFALEFANRDTWEAGISREARPGYSSLHSFKEYGGKFGVGIGLIDVHRDDVEPAELIRDRIAYAVKVIGDPSRVLASPDCGLRTRSREISFAKLRSLVEGAKLATHDLV